MRQAIHWTRHRLLGFKPKTRTLVAIGFVTVMASAGLIAFAPEPDRRPAAALATPVTSAAVEVRAWSPEVRLYGRVETPRTAGLTALVSAQVDAVRVREGEHVEADQVLVQLDETDAELMTRRRTSELAEARADIAALKLSGEDERRVLAHQETLHGLTQAKVERRRELREQGLIAEETLNAVLHENHAQAIALSKQRALVQNFPHRLASAEARLERAATALEEARVRLARASIKAPFAGRVTELAVAPGELVAPGKVVVRMYDDAALEVRVHIPNVHLPAIERALAAGERPPAHVEFDGWEAQGTLDRLVGAVEAGQSGVDGFVRLSADAAPPDLGRAVSLRIGLPPVRDAVAVPVQSVYGQDRLFLVEDGLLVGIDVERVGELKVAGELKLLVRSPALAAGDRVLTSQLSNAVTGLRVTDAEASRPMPVGTADSDGALDGAG